MYYVPDGTEMCGYYECKDCGSRFLDVKIGPQIVCPYCGEEPDMEIGPDEEAESDRGGKADPGCPRGRRGRKDGHAAVIGGDRRGLFVDLRGLLEGGATGKNPSDFMKLKKGTK